MNGYFHLRDLPPQAKLFVGLFTALMLCVCLWAIGMLYESQGKPDNAHLPAYLQSATTDTVMIRDVPPDVQKDIHEIWEDSAAVLAPQWDSQSAGRTQKLDSATIARIAHRSLHENDEQNISGRAADQDERNERRFRRNLGLAHTHVNGQTLLFFAIGLVFLFSSASAKTKRILFWVFGVAVFFHAIGLTKRHTHWVFDDMLAVSGVAILVSICYMALIIFMDLARKPRATHVD